MWNTYGKLIGHSVFANVVLIAVIATSVLAGFSLKRESSPRVEIPFIRVVVSYPGADPIEVEEGVSQKIEAAIASVQGVRRYLTTSEEGECFISIEVADGFEARDVKDRVQNAVDGIADLPAKAERPVVVQAQEDEGVALVMISGDISERQLKELAVDIRDEIEALPDVSAAYIGGARDYEINVEVSEERLRQIGLSVSDVSHAIRQGSQDGSAGSIALEGESIRLRTLGKNETAEAIAGIAVKAATNGELIRIGDIAQVRDGFVEDTRYSRFNGVPAIAVSVQKSPGEDAITILEQVSAYVDAKQPTLPENVHLTTAFDNTEFVKSQLSMITWNGLSGLFLVLLILWLVMEPKLAFWVAMGIPISLGGSLILLWLLDASLNQISLVGMIVVMGILDDDAIMVGEAIYVHRQRGKAPLAAAVDGIREVAMPVLASSITTMAAFAPLLFMPGVFGQFARQMPLVVIAALVVSLFECFFMLPSHLIHGTARPRPSRSRNRFRVRAWVTSAMERFIEKVYGPVVRWTVENRYVTLAGALAMILLTIGLVGGGFIPVLMWPGVEADFADGYVEFPPGTPRETVFAAVHQMEDAALAVGDRETTHDGSPFIRFEYAEAPRRVDTGGRIEIQLTPTSNRDMSSSGFMAEWSREIGSIPGALMVSFAGAQIGAGNSSEDIEFWLQGEDVASVRNVADEFKDRLRKYDGVYAIQDNFRPGKKELEIQLKPSAATLGLTLDDLSRHLYAGYYGEEAFRIQRGREDVRVKVRYPQAERQSLDRLYASRVETPSGAKVPFLSAADVQFREGVSSINGVDGVRGVRVSAMVDRNRANPAEINAELIDSVLPELAREHPGVTWALSGAEENNRAVMEAMTRNLLISLLAIFVILCTVFRSYSQPVIIMLIIPFGIVGALLGHLVLGLPLSFLSLTGIVSLCGVLVNNAIVLIERSNSNLADGMPLTEAVCEAGRRRFRPIVLTSLTTSVGLLPLITVTDLQAQIVIPMAVSIACGVAFGTLLALILIPAFLTIMNDVRRTAHRALHGVWPSPEEVEPAAGRNTLTGSATTAPQTECMGLPADAT